MIDRELFNNPFFTWRRVLCSKDGPESSTTRHVLLTLSCHMNEFGDSCYPGIELLVTESGLSKKTIIDHLRIAEETGWIDKEERPERNGQGWRKMAYTASIPSKLMDELMCRKGGEGNTPPLKKGGEPAAKGGEPNGEKVVKELHLSTSCSTSKRFTPTEGSQSQNKFAGPTCAKCKGPTDQGITRLRIGVVCRQCHSDYMDGKWNMETNR